MRQSPSLGGEPDRRALVAVASGDAPADLVVTGGRVVLVQSGEVLEDGVVTVAGRHIAYVGTRRPRIGAHTRVVEAGGAWVLPTYFEPHAHPFVAYNPDSYSRAMVRRGVTTAVADLLNLQTNLPPEYLPPLLDALEATPFRWLWAVRILGQGGQRAPQWRAFARDQVEALWARPRTVEVAEITDWPALLSEPGLTAAVQAARARGLRIDGHTAGAGESRLQALAAAGLDACHEAITADEALWRLRAGLSVLLRHSSLRHDLDQWVRLYRERPDLNWGRCLLTHDGANPAWVSEAAAVDGMVAELAAAGMPAVLAVQLATLNPAVYFGYDRLLGLLAPGRLADLQIREGLAAPPRWLWVEGQALIEDGHPRLNWPAPDWRQFPFLTPAPQPFAAQPASYLPAPDRPEPVGRLESTVIVREAGWVAAAPAAWPPGLCRAVLFSRDGSRLASMWLAGFADNLAGLATTFLESGGLLVLGQDPGAMAAAAGAVLAAGGGVALTERPHGLPEVVLDLSLDGKMSPLPWDQLEGQVRRLHTRLAACGYRHDEPLYTLDFLTADFLPDLRLLETGVYHVKRRVIMAPARTLPMVPDVTTGGRS